VGKLEFGATSEHQIVINCVSEQAQQDLMQKVLSLKTVDTCASVRPTRKTLCQLEKNHSGSHRAVIYWETELVSSKDGVKDET
jgi:hypothetical protein